MDRYIPLKPMRFVKTLLLFILILQCSFFIVSAESEKQDTKADNKFILYIQGLDTRGDQMVAAEGNADVNILAFVNPDDHKVLLLSTPRDYYYYLRGNTDYPDKITHCGYYGIDCSIDTFNSLYDIDIDYYVRLGFNSIRKIIDDIGGVTVYSEWDFSKEGYDFHVGENLLNGDQALAFCRERYTLPGGDRARGKNQQSVITGVIKKLASDEMMPQIPDLMTSLLENVTTDFPTMKLLSLVSDQLETNAQWDVESIQVDGPGGWDYCTSLRSSNDVVYINWDTVNAAKDKIKEFMSE